MNIPYREMIYANMLILSNQIKAQMDKFLVSHEITSQQWMLSLLVLHGQPDQRTIKQIAGRMGSSHQNIKQIALKLERRDLVVLEKNPNDLRETMISGTVKLRQLWKDVEPLGIIFLNQLFSELQEDELEITNSTIIKMMENLSVIEQFVKEGDREVA